jgi:RNA polymerase sigma-70 factor (ECF subfamily)
MVSKHTPVREWAQFGSSNSRPRGCRVSYGEPIALRGQLELEQVAVATPVETRPTTEALFIERLRHGDANAFERLVQERSGEIYGLLYRLTESREEAKDLTQETFLRAFQNITSFRGESDLRTWIYRIAINQARNRWRWWRRRRRDATFSLDSVDDPGRLSLLATLKSEKARDPEQDTLAHEREVVLKKALSTLRRVYREAVVLRDIEGFAYEEIAVALDISIGTVKSRLARGRQELRRKLEGSL